MVSPQPLFLDRDLISSPLAPPQDAASPALSKSDHPAVMTPMVHASQTQRCLQAPPRMPQQLVAASGLGKIYGKATDQPGPACPSAGQREWGRFCSHAARVRSHGGVEGEPGFLSQKTLLEAEITHQLPKAVFACSHYRGVLLAAREPHVESLPWRAVISSPKVRRITPISTEPFVCGSQGPLVSVLCSSGEPGSGHLTRAKTPLPIPNTRPGFPASGSARTMIPTPIVSSY